MEKDIQSRTIAPAPKTTRGYLSALDVNDHHILYFNAATVVLLPQDPTRPVLSLVHLTDVAAVRFSPDGRLVASIDSRGTLMISEICPDKILLVKQYDNFFANAKSIDWSADGKRICAVGEGKTSFGRVGLVETGTNAGEITGVTGTLNSCSFRPERPFKLVLGGDEMTLKFYEGPPYSFKQSDQSHKGFINQLKYSPKGNYIVAGGADRKLTLHEGLKYQRIAEKENAHNGGIFGVDWIDEEHFVTCSSDKLIKIWNIKMEELYSIQTGSPEDMKNPKKIQLFLVAVRAYKDLIYAINLEGNILVYKNPLITHKITIIRTISGARNKVTKLIPFNQTDIILLDAGGRLLTFSLMRNKVQAIDVGTSIKNIFSGFLQDVQDSKELFLLLEDGTIAIYRTSSSAQELKFYKKLDNVEFKFTSSFQKDLFVGASINSVTIYDSNKQSEVKTIKINEDITYLESNASFIIVGTLKGKIIIFDENLTEIGRNELATFKVSTIKLIAEHPPKPHSNLALIGDSLGNMKLLRVTAGGIQAVKDTMGGHSSLITHADSDEKWIYTFSMDGKVNLWNRLTLKREKQLTDIVKGGILAGLSIQGRLAVAGDDLLVKVIPKIY